MSTICTDTCLEMLSPWSIAVSINPVENQTIAPNFQPMFVVAKRLDGLRCQLVRRYASVQATLCWIGTQCPQKRAQPPIFGACLLWPYGCPSQLLMSTVELFIGYFTHPCSMIRLPMSWHWTLVYRVRFTHYWYTVVYCSTRSEKSHI